MDWRSSGIWSATRSSYTQPEFTHHDSRDGRRRYDHHRVWRTSGPGHPRERTRSASSTAFTGYRRLCRECRTAALGARDLSGRSSRLMAAGSVLQSTPGQGSEFTTLLVSARRRDHELRKHPGGRRRTRRSEESCAWRCPSQGFEVIEARSGEEGTREVQDHPARPGFAGPQHARDRGPGDVPEDPARVRGADHRVDGSEQGRREGRGTRCRGRTIT